MLSHMMTANLVRKLAVAGVAARLGASAARAAGGSGSQFPSTAQAPDVNASSNDGDVAAAMALPFRFSSERLSALHRRAQIARMYNRLAPTR
jgi:hypothetical protein